MKINVLAALLGLPTLALAQSSPSPSSASHGYLGLGVSVLNASILYSPERPAPPTAVGPVLTTGWQFCPRLAVQLSPAVQWYGRTESGTGTTGLGTPLPVQHTYRTRSTQVLVPLLLRLTLTSPAARLRLDALAGAAWLHYADTSASSSTDTSSGAVLRDASSTRTDDQALLTLGPALRYALGPHLDLTFSVPVQCSLRQPASYSSETGYGYWPTSFNNRLLLQPQLGASYALGGR